MTRQCDKKKGKAPLYEAFSLDGCAKLALNYLTRMTDPERDFLPYWLVQINATPAWAKHCRVDDAELVASWHEALWCARRILGTDDGGDALAGFRRHLFRHWDKDGLRYHEPYPWTHTIHHSFHEDAYVLSALNRIIEAEDDSQARALATGLVKALRGLVYERKTRCFWSGDAPIEGSVYEFPNDIYLRGRGFDFTCVTGRGEPAIRHGAMLHALASHWQLTGEPASLDLATGIANQVMGISRYFNYRGEFFGHVHSALWFAAGLALLGRLTGQEKYLEFCRKIYGYVLSLSSSFGWVPEFAQWHPMAEEHCETCCIRDMILCGFELIDAGDDEPYDMINRYVRNQLSEQQIKTGAFIGVENDRVPEAPGMTYAQIDQRVVGGWSGGAEPNSISLSRFRSVAGCCGGTAPQALYQVWSRIVEERGGLVFVNFPMARRCAAATVEPGYPNEGRLRVTAGRAGDYRLRLFPFMKDGLSLWRNGKRVPVVRDGGCARVDGARKGDVIEARHRIVRRRERERVRGVELEVVWQGCDVVEMNPPGAPLRLYQRRLGVPKEIPPPPAPSARPAEMAAGPTEQKR